MMGSPDEQWGSLNQKSMDPTYIYIYIIWVREREQEEGGRSRRRKNKAEDVASTAPGAWNIFLDSPPSYWCDSRSVPTVGEHFLSKLNKTKTLHSKLNHASHFLHIASETSIKVGHTNYLSTCFFSLSISFGCKNSTNHLNQQSKVNFKF